MKTKMVQEKTKQSNNDYPKKKNKSKLQSSHIKIASFFKYYYNIATTQIPSSTAL